MMNFVPFENIDLRTPLSPEEIHEILTSKLELKSRKRNSDLKYVGFSQLSNFEMQRILKSGTNSFIPITKADVVKAVGGSILKVEIRLQKWVYVFVIFFVISTGMNLFSRLMYAPSEVTLVDLLFVSASYILSTVVFLFESKTIKRDLKVMLNTSVVRK